MKFCYCDESGTGSEPVAVMAGIVADADRMHVTKEHWSTLLEYLSRATGRVVTEVHFRDLYSGRTPYHQTMDGAERAELIDQIVEWVADRRHHVVYAAVDKAAYADAWAKKLVPDELNTEWRFIGFHLMLAMQRRFMSESRRKGNTVFVFDNKHSEESRFADLVLRPPAWSAEYYDRPRANAPLDQLVDVPYFADSRDVALIQLADAVAFILRRFAEVESGEPERYQGEATRLSGWAKSLADRSIGRQHIYPRARQNDAHKMFFELAPIAIRDL